MFEVIFHAAADVGGHVRVDLAEEGGVAVWQEVASRQVRQWYMQG